MKNQMTIEEETKKKPELIAGFAPRAVLDAAMADEDYVQRGDDRFGFVLNLEEILKQEVSGLALQILTGVRNPETKYAPQVEVDHTPEWLELLDWVRGIVSEEKILDPFNARDGGGLIREIRRTNLRLAWDFQFVARQFFVRGYEVARAMELKPSESNPLKLKQ